ncbi:hypothetical protein Pst134EA_017879 [Puccinia striiformis f. sp. tritici]|uniref:hypothetical protein n=1 Tax=Puccinia striiformis f. sp. tritici TaxID=168172 RepID=UPI002007380D|nr:hypothetical protein Pst134EA_017879 [Puccinia striiformis f. sp. tritici]KAH9461579.1 hypothetical protein Pst134EA_017879 [Puccinia striiformis f. sp. tritici]
MHRTFTPQSTHQPPNPNSAYKMASRKRRTSNHSSASSIPEPRPKKRTGKLADSDDEDDPPATEATDPDDTQSSKAQYLTNEQELAKALRVHKNAVSATYAYFKPPQLPNQLNKYKHRMLAYLCIKCGGLISRSAYNSSPSNLSKHVAGCLKKQQDTEENQKLGLMGVSGTGDVNPRELCAVWCAEATRPFSALGEASHLGLMHPTVVQNLPTQKTVSSDIGRLYTALQETVNHSLQN